MICKKHKVDHCWDCMCDLAALLFHPPQRKRRADQDLIGYE